MLAISRLWWTILAGRLANMRFDVCLRSKTMRVLGIAGIVLSGLLAANGVASPTSFDGDLVRAEVVFVGRIVSQKGDKVTLRPTRVLRGRQIKDLVLSGWEGFNKEGAKVDYLLMSQGDDAFGKPEPTAMRPPRGQMVWRGWVAYAILKDGEKEIVSWALGYLDEKPLHDHSAKLDVDGLFMDHVMLLLERTP
ncbi:MAG TPA: hypothetical protein VK961_05885, partial [Chthoniobacter sp.]|nr:hypothetical protein [Chthoniobacter sp.]